MNFGKSVRLFLADGSPGGLLTAEIMNWTGHVVAAPRSDLAALMKRPETSRTGVYVLLGDDPDTLGGQIAYIGEGDDIRKRLQQHSRPEEQGGKDFWNRAIILTSKDANLTKAHARYLESRFIALAKLAKRAHLLNGTTPPTPALPEADASDMEYYISQAKIVLPVLGVNLLRSAATSAATASATDAEVKVPTEESPLFELRLKKGDIQALAREVDGEFTVLGGSHARQAWVGPSNHGYEALREKLLHEGAIGPAEDGSLRFAHDTVFASPSAAAAVVVGRTANGRIEWKVQGTGLTYGAWQNQGVDDASEEQSA
ncbi:GIY-YIG nuclease family protein [Mycolicibacterium sp. ND9-15]|uniref:GIY-YIG nuclease family protein n=1 Tax=Mycolicibacterium sp. ND9-15 TaxID=3042320 RepID=UPI002DD7A686|nr:GIY-YIG nuclease family protein [Mycolicibacterium sp. ND9-15]WSE57018.1 GIY-YIG nuclease family protein [Mycolicibacterium sp. ND9-15]